MKCQYCNGTGEHINDANRMTTCEFCGGTGEVEVVGDSVTDVCDKCGGTGFCEMKLSDGCTLGSPCPHQKPLTNDEWRRTCSTEEFAEFIRQLLYASCKPEERVVRKKIGDYFANKYDGDIERTWKEAVKEWLKEKHHE